MKIPPKVSVIIPVYNTPEGYLRQCLESILGQTLQELQIICVDDCSTDGSLAILEEYAQKDSRILLVASPVNQDVAISRNLGVTLAQGEFLYFMDCDDWLEQEALERLTAKAEGEQLDSLLFQGKLFYEEEALAEEFPFSPYFLQFPHGTTKKTTGKELFETLVEHREHCGMVWIFLFRASYFRREKLAFEPMCPGQGDDNTVNFQNFLRCESMAMYPAVFYHYRLRAGSGTTKKRTYGFFQGHLVSLLQRRFLWQQERTAIARPQRYQEYFQAVEEQLGRRYFEITGQDPTKTRETLENLGHLLGQEPLVTLETWAEFGKKRLAQPQLCFFGAGVEGREQLGFFRRENLPLPLAICDNSPQLQGGELEGIPVLSFAEAQERYKNLAILITNRRYYLEIFQQVKEKLPPGQILTGVF